MNTTQLGRSLLVVAVGLASIVSERASAIEGAVGDARTKAWGDDTYNAIARPLVVTSSNPFGAPPGGDRLAAPGDPATSAGVNVDGVARLFIDVDPAAGLGGICSGSLLGGGQHVLTAAHCVTNDEGTSAVIDGEDGNFVVFETPGGNIVRGFTAADVATHPSYDGDFLHGFDVAVIDLGTPVDLSVPRYALNSNLGIDGNPHLAVGYGVSGHGATGANPADFPSGAKRSGLNNFETIGLPVDQIENLDTQLTADFDSGQAAGDAFGVLFGLAGQINGGLGFGENEIVVAPGDSGGPTFILEGGVPVIAGVHSYGLRLELLNGTTSDVDGDFNSSFGEFYVDARVAHPEVLSFIQSAIAIPEPGGVTLLALGMFGLAASLRGKRVAGVNSKQRVAPLKSFARIYGRLLAKGLAVVVMLAMPASASGQLFYNWVGPPTGGFFTNPVNWSRIGVPVPSGIPGPTDGIGFSNANNQVNFTTNVEVARLFVLPGSVDFRSANGFGSLSITVNDRVSLAGTLNLVGLGNSHFTLRSTDDTDFSDFDGPGLLRVHRGASFVQVPNGDERFVVGNAANGTLEVIDGGEVTTIGVPASVLAGLPSGRGTAIVDGAGSRWASGFMWIGQGGQAALNVTNGGLVEAASVQVGGSATSSGVVTLAGADARMLIGGGTGPLVVGGAAGVGGDAIVNVDAGGVLTARLVSVFETGRINLRGGTVNLSNFPSSAGQFDFQAGTLNVLGDLSAENPLFGGVIDVAFGKNLNVAGRLAAPQGPWYGSAAVTSVSARWS